MTVEELNVKVTADISDLKRDLGKMEKAIKGSSKKSETAMGGAMKKIGGAIAVAFSAQALISFSKKVIEVRSEFEKFEAVLTNTLGSSGAAKLALLDIKEMAARTPFSVAELSGAFVKLTNYGLQPSMEAMRQYGDLASSVGKGFDQLAEAVADATTGEFERLKEFGIKASKQGDKVTFTFKEQATTVDFTTKAIENYVKGLGDLEGVSGSMAAISETLGGSVSNLGDKFDSLLNTIGETDVWGDAVTGIANTTSALEDLIKVATEEDWVQTVKDSGIFKLYELLPGTQLLKLAGEELTEFAEVNRKKAEAIDEANKKAAESLATYEAAVKAGATPMGQIPTAEKPFVPVSAGFNLMTLDPKTGMPIPIGSKDEAEKSKKLTKEEIKAREKAKEEMIDFANAMNLVTTYLEGGVALPTEVERAGARRRFQMFEETGQLDLGGMLNVGFEEEEGIPAFEDAKVYLADTNEAMFDFGSSASILSQSLVAAAHDTENASDIFRNAIGGIVSELTTQLLAAQLGKFAGPIGGLIGGLITLKGRDLETSRTRTQNSVTRYN